MVYFVALRDGTYSPPGKPWARRLVRKGEVVAENHPCRIAHPDWFERDQPVEQATAAPGEKRSTRRER